MPRLIGSLFAAARILVLWCAFAGAGAMVLDRVGPRGGRRIPAAGAGIVTYLLIAFLLSLLHLLKPLVLLFLILVGAIYFITRTRKHGLPSIKHFSGLSAILALLTLVIAMSNVFRASLPNVHSDPMITYAVQPDRWLEEGNIYFLEETRFSLLPQVGEVLSVWPAAMASDRMDRLSLLQLFQMSMLIASLIYAWRLLCRKKDLQTLLIILVAGLASSKLAGWGSLAKVDMTLLFFSTAALSHAAKCKGEESSGLYPAFLFLGLAAGTKHTAWLLLPAMILLCRKTLTSAGRRDYLIVITLLLLPPIAYAVRTLLHSGMLMFPNPLPFPGGDPFWLPSRVESLSILESYSGAGILRNVRDLAAGWSYPAIIYSLGVLELLRRRRFEKCMVLISAAFTYGLLCILMFDPVQWGSKYTILMMPFMAAMGASVLSSSSGRKWFYWAVTAFVILSASLLPRMQFTSDFVTDPQPLQLGSDLYGSPRNIQSIANDLLNDDSRILSLFSGERYFSDFPVYCARTYPYARRIFTVSDMASELELLEELGITHVYFNPRDPMEMGLHHLNYWNPPEDRPDPAEDLDLINHVNESPGLRPLATDGRYVLYQVIYPAGSGGSGEDGF